MNKKDIAAIRKEYKLRTLNETDVLNNPIDQAKEWLDEAINAQLAEPTAMTLATTTLDGKPSARIVLLKNIQPEGFVFFTNYESRKGRTLSENPYGALVFFWTELERQLRIEGKIEILPSAQSDSYFESRPQGSKLGAWASPQSRVIPDRSYIEKLVADFEKQFTGKLVERPSSWGGYLLKPTLIEFWQGRESRLHDRIQYKLMDTSWIKERLAP